MKEVWRVWTYRKILPINVQKMPEINWIKKVVIYIMKRVGYIEND